MANSNITTLARWLTSLSIDNANDWALSRMLNMAIDMEYLCADLDENEQWGSFETSKQNIASLQKAVGFVSGWSYPSAEQKTLIVGSLERAIERARGKGEAA